MEHHNKAVRILAKEAHNRSGEVLDELRPLRINRADLDSQRHDAKKERGEKAEGGQDTEYLDKRIEQLDRKIAELDKVVAELGAEDMAWNKVERDLYNKLITEETRQHCQCLVRGTRQLLESRLVELDRATTFAGQAKAIHDAVGEQRNRVVLHVSINLGDARDRWSFIHGDDTGPLGEDDASNYSAIFNVIRQRVHKEMGTRNHLFDPCPVSGIYDVRLFAPGLFVDSGAVARIFSVFNVSAMTVLDPLARQGLPSDTVANLNAAALMAQARQLVPFLKRLADHQDLNLTSKFSPTAHFSEAAWSAGKSDGPAVKRAGAGSAMADQPVRNAIVAIVSRHALGPWNGGAIESVPPGFVFPIIANTDINGTFEVGPCSLKNYRQSLVFAVTFDKPSTGRPSRGIITNASSARTSIVGSMLNKFVAHLFKTRFKTLVGYGFNRAGARTTAMRAASTAKFSDDDHLLCEL
ncbi:MAG: hypothetical protein KAU28_02785, partial [Phycisphaerae bacterium]|nr:hypothetical protein [Phycisphaerae bacterium]